MLEPTPVTYKREIEFATDAQHRHVPNSLTRTNIKAKISVVSLRAMRENRCFCDILERKEDETFLQHDDNRF